MHIILIVVLLTFVVPQGYAAPVGTFAPIFEDVIETSHYHTYNTTPNSTISRTNSNLITPTAHSPAHPYSRVIKQLNLKSSFDAQTFMRSSLDFQKFSAFFGSSVNGNLGMRGSVVRSVVCVCILLLL